MKECVKLEHAQKIPQEVLEKNKVTIEEIHEALCEIENGAACGQLAIICEC